MDVISAMSLSSLSSSLRSGWANRRLARDPTLYRDWAHLISFIPPRSVQCAVMDRGPIIAWSLQNIDKAKGIEINLDYYPIEVSQLPVIGGTQVSAVRWLQIFRQGLILPNIFVDYDVCDFEPFDPRGSDGTKWASEDPAEVVNAVLHLDIKLGVNLGDFTNLDDAAVVVSACTDSSWTFTTIWTLSDFGHPVSGNRQFGFTDQGGGRFTFYIRGADRLTGIPEVFPFSSLAFSRTHMLWTSMQKKFALAVNELDGHAEIGPPVHDQPYWAYVRPLYYHPTGTWLTHDDCP
jgi:hypothetical protein